METIAIEKKKYFVAKQKMYEELQSLAGAKSTPQKKLSVKAAKSQPYQLIDAWAKKNKHNLQKLQLQ